MAIYDPGSTGFWPEPDWREFEQPVFQEDRSDNCACPHFDRCECANMRMRRIDGVPRDASADWEPCDCRCHDYYDDEMDEEDAV